MYKSGLLVVLTFSLQACGTFDPDELANQDATQVGPATTVQTEIVDAVNYVATITPYTPAVSIESQSPGDVVDVVDVVPPVENVETSAPPEQDNTGQEQPADTSNPVDDITPPDVTDNPVDTSGPVTSEPPQDEVTPVSRAYSFTSLDYFEDLELSNAVYYVDSSAGNDANSGAQSSPFKTIQFAVDKLKQYPDHDLVIKNGVYTETVKIIGLRGTANNPIVIRAATPLGAKLNSLNKTRHKSDQINRGLSDSAVFIDNSSHIKLAGLHIKGSRGFGIRVDDSDHILLKQNKTYNTGQSGIKANYVDHLDLMWNEIQRAVQVFNQECLSVENLTNFRIIGNKIHDRPTGNNVYSLQSDYILTYPIGKNKAYYQNCYANNPYDFEGTGRIRMQTTCATRGGEGIDVKNGSQDGVIAYNTVLNIQNKFGLYLDSWGIEDDGSELIQENIEVHHNIVVGAGTGLALSTENGSSEKGVLRNINLHDNIIYGSLKSGFGMGNHGGTNADFRIDKVRRVENITLKNNMFVNNGSYGLWLANPHAKNIVLQDNIIAHNLQKQVYYTSDVLSTGSVPEYKYSVVNNLIDTTSRDYNWLNSSANTIVNLPTAQQDNGYLSDLSMVVNNQKGIMDDRQVMIQQLDSIINN